MHGATLNKKSKYTSICMTSEWLPYCLLALHLVWILYFSDVSGLLNCHKFIL